MKKNELRRHLWALALLLAATLAAQPTGSITQGRGVTTIADLMPNCPSNHVTPLGAITSGDGKTWIVPAENNFQSAPKLADLHNTCNGVAPANLAAANLSNVPVFEIDPGGEVITGYLFCDNYFELYINGILIGVDAVPFTPFNASVVKFRVSKPYTIAVKLVDWEENPGLGSEINNGNTFHPGDGGFIAQFSDGTVTDATWKAQVFYIAPIQDLNAVVEKADGTRSTAGATLTPTCNANCYGVHYPIPADWTARHFDEAGWVDAGLYTAAQVTNQAAFKNFETTAWGNARFIWTSNLVLDNLVLVRKTVGISADAEAPPPAETGFSLAPNPAAAASFTLFAAHADKAPRPLDLLDAQGRVVWTGILPPNTSELPLSLGGLPPGVYSLRLRAAAGVQVRKLVLY